MTDPTIEELHRWSAEVVMGWVSARDEDNLFHLWFDDKGNVMASVETNSASDWRPDDPNSGDIWMVVEKMRKKGFNANFNWQGHPGITIAIAQFHKISPFIHGQGADDNPCLAFLKAAYAALSSDK